jgi:hypothetical protein
MEAASLRSAALASIALNVAASLKMVPAPPPGGGAMRVAGARASEALRVRRYVQPREPTGVTS